MIARPEIDQLIEEGLTRYGHGDFDGALVSWERVLALDPRHERATSYVDYVRMNYELLRSERGAHEAPGAFGPVAREPRTSTSPSPPEPRAPPFTRTESAADSGDDYQIEITTSERAASDAQRAKRSQDPPLVGRAATPEAVRSRSVDPLDRSWVLDEDTGFAPPLTFAIELEADIDGDGDGEETLDVATQIHAKADAEPAAPRAPAAGPAVSGDAPSRDDRDEGAAHDDAAAHDDEAEIQIEYDEPPPAASEPRASRESRDSGDLSFDVATREYTGLRTTTRELDGDFAAQVTDIRPRAMGFVQPARAGRIGPVGTDADPELPTQERSPLVSAPTRDLGIKPGPRRATTTSDEEPTEVRVVRVPARGSRSDADATPVPRPADIVWTLDPIDARSAEILEAIDEGAPRSEPRDERTRRRITALFERADAWGKAGELDRAVTAVDLALSEDPNTALAQKLILRHRETIMAVFQAFLGDLHRAPALARPLHELGAAPISPRAAFLLSRIDGVLSLDEILDVSGMPPLEAHRYLCQLFLRGILHMR